MRVLHLASFQGNIGDGANHSGFRACFGAAAAQPVQYSQFEIRQTYWGEKSFDVDFVREANAHDLVVVGGGNFFELSIEKSRTGATFDVPPEQLARIQKPILFNGLGCDQHKGYSPATVSRFRAFLDHVLADPRHAVSVRNDGSLETVRSLFGDSYAARIERIADCGFFLDLPGTAPARPVIAVNVAADMPELRFDAHGAKGAVLSAGDAMQELASALQILLDSDPELGVVFIPHVFSDIDAISEVLRRIPDRLRRRRVDIAPYSSAMGGYVDAFQIYRSARVVLGMRFHATVCSIGMGRPVVCMMSYPKMADLLDEIQRPEIGVQLYKAGCGRRIADAAVAAMAQADTISRASAALRARLWDGNIAFYRRALAQIMG